MNDHKQPERCAGCATTEGPLQGHHVALRANHPAIVLLCPRCHSHQTERQLQAGLIGRGTAPPGDRLFTTIYALVEGMFSLFTARARRAGNRELAKCNQQSRRATLRLLVKVSDGRPGTLGPRPISNDRRHCAQRHSQPHSAPTPRGTDTPQTLASILAALADVAADLLAGDVELLPGFTVNELRVSFSPSGAQRLARNLDALEDHPRAAEVGAIIERDWKAAIAAVEQLAVADVGDDDGAPLTQRTESLGDFYALGEHWIECLRALAAGDDPAPAFERILDHRAGTGTPGTVA